MEYSVLMTVYKNDNPEYFKLALESMINQTKKPDEIVLVNDGPIPEVLQNTINLLNTDGVIKQINLEKNVGLGLALNEGLKACKNELIARMDSDDISLPSRCERQVREFEKNPSLDIVGLPVKEFSDNVNNIVGERIVPLTNKEIYQFAKTRDPFNHPTVMYRKSKVIESGMYGNYRKNQDTDLWIKMLSHDAVCMNISDDLFRFRFDNNTYKKRKNWENTKLLIDIRKKAWKSGYCSFIDFVLVAIAQFGIYIMPEKFQKLIYTKILRR